MYNATNVATWLRAPQRFATRLRVLRRAATQLNDLFVTLLRIAPHRGAPLRCSTQCNATICLFLFAPQLAATWLAASRHPATQRFVCYNASPRGSALHWAPRLPAAHLASTQLNDLFITSYRPATQLSATLRFFRRRFATQRFVCQFIIAPRHGSRQRTAAQLGLPRRAATQRNELKLN